MRYASLASGSKGNCHAINDEKRILLIDAGISLRQIEKRLESLGWSSDQVRGVAITHEHSDHIHAVDAILKKTDWMILATPGTVKGIKIAKGIDVPESRWIPLEAGHTIDWDGWRLHPFTISHDTIDPVAYRIEADGVRLAVITDLGYVTKLVVEYASDSELLVLEANHDVMTLRDGSYRPQDKIRILSRAGHLSNDACAELLARVLSPALRHIVLAHLSERNNDPAQARLAAADAINTAGSGAKLHIASQREVLEIQI